ncbi:MAG: RecX family transcriptional regulator [Bacilli bacterium]|jgi:regulatory protein
MQITRIIKKGQDKYQVDFNTKDCLILYEDVLIRHALSLEKEIDQNLFKKLKKENEEAEVYFLVLKYLKYRFRSEYEVITYLKRKRYKRYLINKTIKRLKKEGHLNDKLFMEAFIHDKFNFTNDGPYKIKRELLNHQLEESLIEDFFLKIDQELLKEKLKGIIQKQIKINTKYSGYLLKQKLFNYLFNLGYDKEMILEELNTKELSNQDNLKEEYDKLYKLLKGKYKGKQLDFKIKQRLYQRGYNIDEIEYLLTKNDF